MADAYTFIADLRSRIDPSHRIQLTTDGLRLHIDVVDSLFRDNIDYSILHKLYDSDADAERTYSPSQCIGIDKRVIAGTPDLDVAGTSFVERQNLTHAVNLHYMHCNFVRPHQTLSKRYGRPMTPAMAAGIAQYPWSYTQITQLLD